MEGNNIKSIAANIIIPIIVGAAIYYIIAPEVVFVRCIDDFLGINFHISKFENDNEVIKFLRNYLMDMLWGYALVFSVFFVLGNNKADIMKGFVIAFAFSVVMEILQLLPACKGTFDMFDIVFMFFAEVAAVFIIRRLTMKEEI